MAQEHNILIDRGSDWSEIFQFTSNPKRIVSSTNASPIVVTIPQHGFTTGQKIRIYGHNSNEAANGNQAVTVIDANTFSLNGTTGTGMGTAQGFAAACIDATGGSIVCKLKDDYSNPAVTINPHQTWLDQTRCRFSLSLTHTDIAGIAPNRMYYDIFYIDSALVPTKRLSGVITFTPSISE